MCLWYLTDGEDKINNHRSNVINVEYGHFQSEIRAIVYQGDQKRARAPRNFRRGQRLRGSSQRGTFRGR